MASLAVIVVAAAVVASMSVAMAFFMDYKPEIVTAPAGERVRVGPNTYAVSYQGTEEDAESPGTVFAKISIEARGPGGDPAPVGRQQFGLVDKSPPPTQPSHGEFGEDGQITAYFPLQGGFDESFEYVLMIRPTKEQSSSDLARVCVANC